MPLTKRIRSAKEDAVNEAEASLLLDACLLSKRQGQVSIPAVLFVIELLPPFLFQKLSGVAPGRVDARDPRGALQDRLFTLQQVLGHSTLEMVRHYVNLASSHITMQHRRFSPLDRLNLNRG